MDGNKILSRLTRLSDITNIKDVKQLTSYMFPGTHCPLMGSALAVRGIENAYLMVIGTEECSYYTKSMAMSKQFGGIEGRCVSVIVDSHDITFGSVETVEKAFDELYKERKPECVFITTTCVIEIIGDDFDSLCDMLSDKYGIPVMAVHTEHFKCLNHIPGIERAITACSDIMEPTEKTNKINILGQRLGDFSKTEVYRVLKENAIEIGLMLPSGCTVEDIKSATGGIVNVVVNSTALPLAQKMKEKFRIPYVLFEKSADPDNIYSSYKNLFDFLSKDMPSEITEKYSISRQNADKYAEELINTSFIYGNTPFNVYDFTLYLCKIGMKPLLMQVSEMSEKEITIKEDICKLADPYVTQSANIASLQPVYDILKPDLYLGHEYSDRLMKKGIAVVSADMLGSMLGFEVTEYMLSSLVTAKNNAKEYQKQLGGEK